MKQIRTLLQLTVFVQLVSALVVSAEGKTNFGTEMVKAPAAQIQTVTVSKTNFGVE